MPSSTHGTQIVTLEEGRGRPIVIIHGGSSRAAQRVRVAGALAGGFRVVRTPPC